MLTNHCNAANGVVFKDEKCFKVFDNKELQKYEDARNTCYQNEGSSLVIIRSQEEQQFLFNLLHNIHNNDNGVWIGAQLKDNSLKWADNITANFTNWVNGNPRNVSGYECVQMSMIEPYVGQWMNEPCDIKHLVVCEKPQNWLFFYLQKTVMELRENFERTIQRLETELNSTKAQLQNTNTDLKNTREEFNRKVSESTPPGSVAYFSAITVPNGWLKANGQSVLRVTYANLFSTIGTTFGSGDGSTTFTLPDLRGEFVRGWSDGRVDVEKDRAFASFQWGSSIPLAAQINDNWELGGATGYQSRWIFSGETFDKGFGIWGPGVTRYGLHIPEKNDTFQTDMPYIATQSGGHVTSWGVMSGTRPRNIALLACIKY